MNTYHIYTVHQDPEFLEQACVGSGTTQGWPAPVACLESQGAGPWSGSTCSVDRGSAYCGPLEMQCLGLGSREAWEREQRKGWAAKRRLVPQTEWHLGWHSEGDIQPNAQHGVSQPLTVRDKAKGTLWSQCSNCLQDTRVGSPML